LVSHLALSDVDALDSEELRLLLDNLSRDRRKLDHASAARLGTALWRSSPEQFADTLDDPSSVAAAAIHDIRLDALVEGIARKPLVGSRIASARPDVLATDGFWTIPGLEKSSIMRSVGIDDANARSVLIAVVRANCTSVATIAVNRLGAKVLLEAINEAERLQPGIDLTAWIRPVLPFPYEVGEFLAKGATARRIAIEISKQMEPEELPNDFGEDPWAIASRSQDRTTVAEETQFAGFLLARGLGYRSRSCALLLATSFDRVHAAVASGEMPEATWRKIERRLAWVYPWLEWDRCRRIRQAVVNKFIDLDLDPASFTELTTDERLFDELVDLASRSSRGRRFLRNVRR
jgi:hypothetical protein